MGDYWKKEAIEWSFEFLTKELKIPIEKLAVSVFKGDKDASRDNESYEIWRRLGIPDKRIAFLPKENNWWGPAGKTGPCGPDTEMFFYKKDKVPETFNPKDENWIEIWNDVLMQYEKNINGKYREAKQKNIDTGMGVERTVAVLNKLNDNYLTDCFLSIIKKIEKISNKKYSSDKEITRSMRIIADHIKASVFIIADGVKPGNIERGYVLRRLIRRAIRFGRNLGLKEFVKESAMPVFEIYDDYKELKEHKNEILNELAVEEKKFLQTLEKGIAIFNKITNNKKTISGKDAFLLYQSYGFPLEITKELAKEKGINVDKQEFLKEEKKHQELSRKATEGIFKSGLADYSEKTVRMHTATHLLNESLRRVLGDEVKQRGSNITPERLRFDFSFGRKLTEEKIKKVEDLVNEKIKQNLDVVKVEMPLEQALNSGAQAEFGHKYPDIVSVYTIIDKKEKQGWFSKEICTGPHVKNTKEIGKFKILKEESVAAGIRRIKAVVLESGK